MTGDNQKVRDYKEIKFDINSGAFEHFEGCLSSGKSLSAALLRNFTIRDGTIKTYLPPEVTEDKAKRFSEGDVVFALPGTEPETKFIETDEVSYRMEEVLSMDDLLEEICSKYLDGDGGELCVVEDYNSRASDGWLLKPKIASRTNIAIFNDEVYHYIGGKQLDQSKLNSTIGEIHSSYPSSVGVLTSSLNKSFQQVEERPKLTKDDLELLARNTCNIIISAYDREGFLIWSKND